VAIKTPDAATITPASLDGVSASPNDPSARFIPAKVRAFVDFVAARLRAAQA
jgi:hypothetical protein